jgi:DNA-binding XRE family transcriptional regulator
LSFFQYHLKLKEVEEIGMINMIEEQIKIIDQINPKFKKKIGLNQKELADILGVSSSTIEARRKDGTGVEYIALGGRYIYPKIKIAEYMINTTVRTN